jgi:hypothetical protein
MSEKHLKDSRNNERVIHVSPEVLENEMSKGFTQQEVLTAIGLGITPAKLRAVREYALLLKRSDPRMKKSTISKKVKEKFHIKVV